MLRKPCATLHVLFAWDGRLRAPLQAHVWLGFRSKSLIPGRKGVLMLRIVLLAASTLMALAAVGCGASVDRPDGLSDKEWEIYLESAVTATAVVATAAAEAHERAIDQAKAEAKAKAKAIATEAVHLEEDIQALVHSNAHPIGGAGLTPRACGRLIPMGETVDNYERQKIAMRQKIMDEFRKIHPNITDGEAYLDLNAKCGHVGIFDITNLDIPDFRWATPTPSLCRYGRDEVREFRNPGTFALIKVKCHSGIPTRTPWGQ